MKADKRDSNAKYTRNLSAMGNVARRLRKDREGTRRNGAPAGARWGRPAPP